MGLLVFGKQKEVEISGNNHDVHRGVVDISNVQLRSVESCVTIQVYILPAICLGISMVASSGNGLSRK